ncbi:RecQ family ATP-dependent DNA helicase [Actinotalea sp. K2]|uniref:RecQ family ATP-dependent DNA helicase n=1 Tax=Actinotalea sp. K2 TaxID=2939438 RepID=UPI002016BB20|nr:RecQ family ATP-dependent DNA helicase [Actinotalea sp. K2]MCL3860106.1 RecQ family ATP-dependent DNA helicase [Actinotalea sp. K2]
MPPTSDPSTGAIAVAGHAAPRGGSDRPALRERAEEVLRALVGHPDARLREDQWTAIEALVADRRRALVVQRTGWGKSAVYFVATSLLREQGSGPTVIVSPLLALMRNQVEAARRAGIRAETIHSANTEEWASVQERVVAGETDVLLVSPERLNNPGFRDEVLPRLAQDAGLLVIDEAHCVSDWGHDFRPDYRRIRDLLLDLPTGTPVLATTATANARVTADVAEQLVPHGSGTPGPGDEPGEEVLVLRGSLDRTSLHLSVQELEDQASRLAWLAQNLPAMPGSGIVYCLTVAAAEQVAAHLTAAGLVVRPYTGQTDPAERLECEQDLLANRVKALVATSALGMGFDKPDLGFVVHLGAPASPIAYYQQVGRAGRATERAEVVLLPGREDLAIWDWFASMAFPPEQEVRAALAALEDAGRTLSTAALEPRVSLRRNRLEMMLKVLDVDGAVRRVRGGWESTGQPWSYDSARYEQVAATRQTEQQSMLDYVAGPGCRMHFLRSALDDPDLAAHPRWQCGRCDRCGGTTSTTRPDEEAVRQARSQLAVPGVEVPARRQWPSGMASLGVPVSGRISAQDGASAGRAVARLDGLGWGNQLRELFSAPAQAAGAQDTLPVALRAPVLEVMDAWSPQVDGVVVIGSLTRPGLVEHLAAGIARHLGVPVVGRVGTDTGRPPGRHDVNSAQRLAGVWQRLSLDLSPAAEAGLTGRSVLLVDDRYDTGWTVTVAARLLRQAGATAVHPFALAIG